MTYGCQKKRPVPGAEAIRDGAPAIDLVDRQELAELLKRYELGVKTVVVILPDKNLFDKGLFRTVGVCFKAPAAPP